MWPQIFNQANQTWPEDGLNSAEIAAELVEAQRVLFQIKPPPQNPGTPYTSRGFALAQPGPPQPVIPMLRFGPTSTSFGRAYFGQATFWPDLANIIQIKNAPYKTPHRRPQCKMAIFGGLRTTAPPSLFDPDRAPSPPPIDPKAQSDPGSMSTPCPTRPAARLRTAHNCLCNSDAVQIRPCTS